MQCSDMEGKGQGLSVGNLISTARHDGARGHHARGVINPELLTSTFRHFLSTSTAVTATFTQSFCSYKFGNATCLGLHFPFQQPMVVHG